MRPLYMCRKDVNMDVNSEFFSLTNAVVGVIFNRPGVAGAVLQTPSLLIN